MIIALNDKNERIDIEKAIKGEKYFCPLCHNELIQKLGSIKAHHFAHRHACTETWSRDMSPWHFWWQRQFPAEACECVFENEGQSHRSDVYLKEDNVIIEFQHSPISISEFKERNKFYKSLNLKVVWLFDFTDSKLKNLISHNQHSNNLIKKYGFQILKGFCFDSSVQIFFQTENDGNLFQSYSFYLAQKDIHCFLADQNFEEFKEKNLGKEAMIFRIIKQNRSNEFTYDFKLNKNQFLNFIKEKYDIVPPKETNSFFERPIFEQNNLWPLDDDNSGYYLHKKKKIKNFEEIENEDGSTLLELWKSNDDPRLRAVNKKTGDIVTLIGWRNPFDDISKFGMVFGDVFYKATNQYLEDVPIKNYQEKIWVKA